MILFLFLFQIAQRLHRRVSEVVVGFTSRHSITCQWFLVASLPLFLVCSVEDNSAVAGDWPQLLGPNRDSRAVDEQPLADWTIDSKPKELWRIRIGAGYSGAVIVGSKVVYTDRVGSEERTSAIDRFTGNQVWQSKQPCGYRSTMNPDSGPRATPVVAKDTVLSYGAAGDLVAMRLADGKTLWQRALRKEYKADDGYFGAGSSPLVIDNTVIVNVGGKKGGIVGLDLATGKTTWESTDYDASYASPIQWTMNGKLYAVIPTRLKTVLLNPEDGKIVSEINFGARGPTVNAATPLKLDDKRLLLTASYGIGCYVVNVSDAQLQIASKDVELLASQYNSPVLVGTNILGVDGREDMGTVALKLLDSSGTKELWQLPLRVPSHLIAVNDRALLIGLDGTVQLGTANSTGWQRHGELKIGELVAGDYRAVPAFSQHTLIVRASIGSDQSELIAFRLP